MKKPLFVIISILFVISEISIAQDWSYYNTDNSEIPGNYIRSFSIKNDTLIIGTQNAGLAIFDQSNWEIFNVENSSIPSNNVNNVIHNDNGIWMNCFIGIGDHYLVRLKNDDWKIWENILNNQKSRFSDIEFDENGIAWMVTGDNSGWVTRFNQVTFESFNSNNSCLPTFSSTRYLPFSIKVIDSESRWIGLLDNQLGSSSLKNTGVVLMENENCIFYNKDNSSFPDNHQAIVEIHKDPLDQNVFGFYRIKEL